MTYGNTHGDKISDSSIAWLPSGGPVHFTTKNRYLARQRYKNVSYALPIEVAIRLVEGCHPISSCM